MTKTERIQALKNFWRSLDGSTRNRNAPGSYLFDRVKDILTRCGAPALKFQGILRAIETESEKHAFDHDIVVIPDDEFEEIVARLVQFRFELDDFKTWILFF